MALCALCVWYGFYRREEAEWMNAAHEAHTGLERLRALGRAAFAEALDLEFHPAGVAHALLRELAYVGEDDGVNEPPAHVLAAERRHVQAAKAAKAKLVDSRSDVFQRPNNTKPRTRLQ